jgi:hypothetical protein
MEVDQEIQSARISSEITVCVTTIDRPHCAQRFIRSVRARYPQLGIILISQGEPHPELAATCAKEKVDLRTVEHDAGVTVARNLAIRLASSKYLLFCDDDFIFGSDTDLGPAWYILENTQSIDILGGLLFDLSADLQSMTVRRWEKYMFVNKPSATLLSLPIDACTPAPRMVGGYLWFDADMVLNWKLVRRSLFDRFPGWDPRYSCNGEHEDFYLAVKMRDDIRVAYAPSLMIYHHNPRNRAYMRQRQRQLGWSLLGEKWQLENYVELAELAPVRRFSQGQASIPAHELNHPALIPNGTEVSVSECSRPGSGKIDSVVSECRREQLADAAQVRLRLAPKDFTVHAPQGSPVAIPVIVDSPFRFGCSGKDMRPQLAYGVAKPGNAVELDSVLGRTPLMQDVCGSTLQYLNVMVPAASDPLASGVDIAIRLWSKASGCWCEGVTMRIEYREP